MQMTKSTLSLLSLVAVWSTLVPGTAEAQKAPKRERDLIAREELVQASEKFPDLYMAVRSLRPQFLAVNNRGTRTTGVGEGPNPAGDPRDPRGARQAGTGGSSAADALPVVYVDGRKSGEPEFLKGLATKDVAEVRFLNPNKAGMEYGLGHDGGAIVVKMFVNAKVP